jgi:HD-GYP domain-containing protein (c-di-GMP phosphodiesterase class II)
MPLYLKKAWVERQLELSLPLLPIGAGATVWLGDRQLAAVGNAAGIENGAAEVLSFPLLLEDGPVGELLVRLPAGQPDSIAEIWGGAMVHAVQGVIASDHARRCVAQETLESYREMALLQRAVGELNLSLQPATVAVSLLKEFEGSKDATDFGALFLYRDGDPVPALGHCFGENAASAFKAFAQSGLFAGLVHGLSATSNLAGDIINDLAHAPLWAGEAPEFHALLWLPLIAHNERLGLLVLASRSPEGFTAATLKRAQTLVSVAATALRNAQLFAAQKTLFQSFVQVIATAIDAKSPYTAGHCRRVPEIALMLAEKAHQSKNGPLAGFVLDDDERNAIEIAAMLHDCGKVVTPEWVIDKATKLDCIVNRLDLVELRFEVLRREALIARYRTLAEGADPQLAQLTYAECIQRLEDDFSFVAKCNSGGEFMSAEHIRRIEQIATAHWTDASGREFPLLNADEAFNLSIQRGTLNPKERKLIENHALHTIAMLSQIPFPRELRRVTDYAGGHHERLDGSGYPHGLRREQLSIPARIMAIADIFEALTAPDRPYRKPGRLSWALGVMRQMKRDNHIDGDLFDLFLTERVYLSYAERFLPDAQIDAVDISQYLD